LPVLLTTGPPAQAEEAAAAVATKQIVVVESPRNDDDCRAAVVEPLEHRTAIAADGERDDCDDRRIIAVADDDTAREQQTAGMEMEMELADDRTFEEFIKSQRRQMWQESHSNMLLVFFGERNMLLVATINHNNHRCITETNLSISSNDPRVS
jgi:hypothetical protein